MSYMRKLLNVLGMIDSKHPLDEFNIITLFLSCNCALSDSVTRIALFRR